MQAAEQPVLTTGASGDRLPGSCQSAPSTADSGSDPVCTDGMHVTMLQQGHVPTHDELLYVDAAYRELRLHGSSLAHGQSGIMRLACTLHL